MTIEEFININFPDAYVDDSLIKEVAVEFAKYHVQQALNAASDSVDYENTYFYSSEGNAGEIVEKEILKSYPLTNIK